MRFLLEFVSCCGSPTQHRLDPAEEEERWLVRVPPAITPRPPCRKKRGRNGARGHDWRPSLGSISEDINVSTSRERTNNDAAAVSATRDVKRKNSGGRGSNGGGAAAAKARHRSYNDRDYRGAAMPTVMPTFSPTPFMF